MFASNRPGWPLQIMRVYWPHLSTAPGAGAVSTAHARSQIGKRSSVINAYAALYPGHFGLSSLYTATGKCRHGARGMCSTEL